MLSVASVPQSYSGGRLRIAPVKTFALTDGGIVAVKGKLYAQRRIYFLESRRFYSSRSRSTSTPDRFCTRHGMEREVTSNGIRDRPARPPRTGRRGARAEFGANRPGECCRPVRFSALSTHPGFPVFCRRGLRPVSRHRKSHSRSALTSKTIGGFLKGSSGCADQ